MEEIKELLGLYGSEMNEEGKFFFILEEIGKLTIKLAKAKARNEKTAEGICELLVHSKSLAELTGVDEETAETETKRMIEEAKETYG